MKNIFIILIVVTIGCKTRKEATSTLKAGYSDSLLNDYIKIGENSTQKHFANKGEIGLISGELSMEFDQEARVDVINLNLISKTIASQNLNLNDFSEKERIMVEVIFDRNGKVLAVSFRVPKNLNVHNFNMSMIEREIKKGLEVKVQNMAQTRKYVSYIYTVFLKELKKHH